MGGARLKSVSFRSCYWFLIFGRGPCGGTWERYKFSWVVIFVNFLNFDWFHKNWYPRISFCGSFAKISAPIKKRNEDWSHIILNMRQLTTCKHVIMMSKTSLHVWSYVMTSSSFAKSTRLTWNECIFRII